MAFVTLWIPGNIVWYSPNKYNKPFGALHPHW